MEPLMVEEPLKVNLNPDNEYSYYLQYEDNIDCSPRIINMFGYCRVSTQIQAQFGSSIETQIQLLINECKKPQRDDNKPVSYNLIRIYVDDGISAKNISNRPGFVELQKQVNLLSSGRSNQKLGVIVSDLSRLTRNSDDLSLLIKWINGRFLTLKFIDNSIDPTTDAGKLILSVMGSFFEFERV